MMAYGSPRYVEQIKKANPNLVPEKMRPGQTIVLPTISKHENGASGSSPTDSSSATAGPNESLDSRTQYKVQSGDSLERIAMKLYGKREMIDRIYEANKDAIGPDKAKLKLNMVLKLPEPPTQTAAR